MAHGWVTADGIPAAHFTVADVEAEVERLRALGVRFTHRPTRMGPMTTAVFDETCGNLIQIGVITASPRDTRLRPGAIAAGGRPLVTHGLPGSAH